MDENEERLTTGQTATAAERKVATVLTVTTRAVSVTTTNLLAKVSDLRPSAGTGVSTDSMGGWMSLQVGGQTLAQVQVVDGQASVSIDTRDLVRKTVSVVYSGDSVHVSSTRSITL